MFIIIVDFSVDDKNEVPESLTGNGAFLLRGETREAGACDVVGDKGREILGITLLTGDGSSLFGDER